MVDQRGDIMLLMPFMLLACGLCGGEKEITSAFRKNAGEMCKLCWEVAQEP
jgi:hypothetical protein